MKNDEPVRVIFLDINGTLNNASTQFLYDDKQCLDKVSVDLLRKLIKDTGARIVVISSWRLGRTFEELRRLIRASAGNRIARSIIGTTAEGMQTRGALVQAWIDTEGIELGITQYAIIGDDSPDVYTTDQREHLVKVDPDIGFRLNEYNVACEMLTRELK